MGWGVPGTCSRRMRRSERNPLQPSVTPGMGQPNRGRVESGVHALVQRPPTPGLQVHSGSRNVFGTSAVDRLRTVDVSINETIVLYTKLGCHVSDSRIESCTTCQSNTSTLLYILPDVPESQAVDHLSSLDEHHLTPDNFKFVRHRETKGLLVFLRCHV